MEDIGNHMWPIEWHHAVSVTLNDLEGHSPVADLFKCNPSNILPHSTACSILPDSTDSVLARFLSDSWASCKYPC